MLKSFPLNISGVSVWSFQLLLFFILDCAVLFFLLLLPSLERLNCVIFFCSILKMRNVSMISGTEHANSLVLIVLSILKFCLMEFCSITLYVLLTDFCWCLLAISACRKLLGKSKKGFIVFSQVHLYTLSRRIKIKDVEVETSINYRWNEFLLKQDWFC